MLLKDHLGVQTIDKGGLSLQNPRQDLFNDKIAERNGVLDSNPTAQ